jgi:protein-serine/threonine kinase
VSQKIKNFFRINSSSSSDSKHSDHHGSSSHKPEKDRSFRQSRFLPHIGRNRSTTVASEGTMLEDSAISPTASANPYFVHQGPPAIRHHNAGSVPPSPPGSPGAVAREKLARGVDDPTGAGKDELARKLRRVASAPNAQGMFANSKPDDRPSTAEMGGQQQQLMTHHGGGSSPVLVDCAGDAMVPLVGKNGIMTPGQIRNAVAFRRTYSSNSIKVRSVEVGPGSFDKIKLIGKGDVGKVYLVREKKSGRLYAMKGGLTWNDPGAPFLLTPSSARQEGNDQAEQDQEGLGGAGDISYQQPSIYCYPIPLISI